MTRKKSLNVISAIRGFYISPSSVMTMGISFFLWNIGQRSADRNRCRNAARRIPTCLSVKSGVKSTKDKPVKRNWLNRRANLTVGWQSRQLLSDITIEFPDFLLRRWRTFGGMDCARDVGHCWRCWVWSTLSSTLATWDTRDVWENGIKSNNVGPMTVHGLSITFMNIAIEIYNRTRKSATIYTYRSFENGQIKPVLSAFFIDFSQITAFLVYSTFASSELFKWKSDLSVRDRRKNSLNLVWFCKIEPGNAGFAEDSQTFLKDHDGRVAIYTILRASISHNDASSRLFVNEVILVALFLVIDNADSHLRPAGGSFSEFPFTIYLLLFFPVWSGTISSSEYLRISWFSRQRFLYRIHLASDRRTIRLGTFKTADSRN